CCILARSTRPTRTFRRARSRRLWRPRRVPFSFSIKSYISVSLFPTAFLPQALPVPFQTHRGSRTPLLYILGLVPRLSPFCGLLFHAFV
ncbi:hypothetical protein EDB84DRAFT_1507630, partial [Lactarius hengduanensis]